MSNVTSAVLLAAAPCVVFAIVASYGAWLAWAPGPARPGRRPPVDWPPIDVIVAVFNEHLLLDGKLDNLARLAYPRDRLRFIIVDGASTDGSDEIAAAWTRKDDRFVALATERPDKAAQLNLGLRHARAPWVLVTDADARMPRETLRSLMTAASRNPLLGLIGSPVLPVHSHPIEQMYWRLLNWLRLRDWRHGSASMVMAPCYVFRRALIGRLPDDVVSDDVHVAWCVGAAGHQIGIAGPVVQELRGPTTVRSLFEQKVRRGSGILREIFRFLPSARRMRRPLRAAFVVRMALFVLGPPLVASAVGAAFALVSLFRGSGAAAVAIGGVLLLRLPSVERRIWRPLVLLTVVTLAASVSLLIYPFVRQAAALGRVPQRLFGRVP